MRLQPSVRSHRRTEYIRDVRACRRRTSIFMNADRKKHTQKKYLSDTRASTYKLVDIRTRSSACIDALGLSWADELQWVTTLANDNPKNYQIWHHRQACFLYSFKLLCYAHVYNVCLCCILGSSGMSVSPLLSRTMPVGARLIGLIPACLKPALHVHVEL
jgi:Cft2 family RNA processing exonuclease